MDSPDQAVYNEAGKGQSASSSNSSSGILWAGSDAVEFFLRFQKNRKTNGKTRMDRSINSRNNSASYKDCKDQRYQMVTWSG